MSRRTDLINLFCTAINGTRGLKYQGEKKLPGRAVFDLTESATTEYGKINATIELTVESILDARGLNEGEALDTELAAIQLAALNSTELSDAEARIIYTGSQYSYSENGSTLVGLVASFNLSYRVSPFNLTST